MLRQAVADERLEEWLMAVTVPGRTGGRSHEIATSTSTTSTSSGSPSALRVSRLR
jgi:hypothetical protein